MSEKEQGGVQRFTDGVLRDFMTLLADPQIVCTIHIGDGANERVIYFVQGGVRLLSVGDRKGPDIADVLLETKRVDVDQLHQILEKVRCGHGNLKQSLNDKGILPRDEYDKINRKLIYDEIFDLVFWDEAFYKTYPKSPPKQIFSQDRQALTGTVDFIDLSKATQRWLGTWARHKRTFRSDLATIVLTPQGKKALQSEVISARELLEFCEGGPTLRTIRRLTVRSLPEVCKHLAGFAEKQWVNIVPPADHNRRDRAQTIADLEEALPKVIDKDIVREKLAHLYVIQKQPDRACMYLEPLAEDAQARGDVEAACEHWKRIIYLDPKRKVAFKKLVEAYFQIGKESELRQLSRQYAETLARAGSDDPEGEVQDVLERIPKARELSVEFQKACRAARRSLGLDGGEGSASRPRRARGKRPPPKKKANTGAKVGLALIALLVLGAGGVGVLCFGGFIEIPGLEFGIGEAGSKEPDAAPEGGGGGLQIKLPPLGAQGGGAPPAGYSSAAPLQPVDASAAVPLNGRPGVDARQLFKLNADGSVTTPLGTAAAPNLQSGQSLGVQPDGLPSFPGGAPSIGEAAAPKPPTREHELKPSLPQTTRAKLRPPVLAEPPPALWWAHDGTIVRRTERGSLQFIESNSSRVLLNLTGELEDFWSIDSKAMVICRWRPGKPVHVHRRSTSVDKTSRWTLPSEAVALAVADRYLAVCLGDNTAIYRMDGSLVVRRRISRWRQGVFVGTTLVCSGGDLTGRGPRLYELGTLKLVWSPSPWKHAAP